MSPVLDREDNWRAVYESDSAKQPSGYSTQLFSRPDCLLDRERGYWGRCYVRRDLGWSDREALAWTNS